MNHIGVIGSGTMGRGIAYQAALSGYDVILQDISKEAIEQAKNYIHDLAAKSAEKGYIKSDQQELIHSNLVYTTDISVAVKEADVVIEAVLEKMDLKIEIFKQVNEFAPAHAILATNTSTMSPTEIGATTKHPEKFVAMHFFNPVHRMKLIEIIRGMDTSDETVKIIKSVAERMGKESVEVNEFPGFVTSRMNCIIGNEAMNMLMEGVASAEDIDKAIKLGLNHPMGPLEMADLVGLDSRLRNMEYLYYHLGEKYRPSPLLTKYVKSGRFGRKSGQGIYDYSAERS
ncbi:3-hydroxyacyl-CoA dehydrogenase [Oceanobacillus saliphilus]|uniref:3-hydroxyacyl-CoA dehydrogenase n=1 Tax=Oceanobacillus saliphilus TaxID=2925834 RepID=UPI00201DA1B2